MTALENGVALGHTREYRPDAGEVLHGGVKRFRLLCFPNHLTDRKVFFKFVYSFRSEEQELDADRLHFEIEFLKYGQIR